MIEVMSASYSIQTREDAVRCVKAFIEMATDLIKSDHQELNINHTNAILREGISNTAEACAVIRENRTSFITITATVNYPVVAYRIAPTNDREDDVVIEEVF